MAAALRAGIERWSRRRLTQLGLPAATAGQGAAVIAPSARRRGTADPHGGARAHRGRRGRAEHADRHAHRADCGGAQGSPASVPTAASADLPCPPRGLARQPASLRPASGPWPSSPGDYLGAFGARDRSGLRLLVGPWPLRDVRAGLRSISRRDRGGAGRGRADARPRAAALPRLPRTGQVRMLGNFDTYLLGWKDREFSVTGEHAAHVKEGGGGWIRPVIVEDGIVVGGWRSARKGGRLEISLNLPKRGARAARRGDRGRDRGHRPLRGHGGHDLLTRVPSRADPEEESQTTRETD